MPDPEDEATPEDEAIEPAGDETEPTPPAVEPNGRRRVRSHMRERRPRARWIN